MAMLNVNNSKNGAAKLVCSFGCLLSLLLPHTSKASQQNNNYLISPTPYTQQVDYKETEGARIFNQEEGSLNGINYQLSYRFDDWQLQVSGDHSNGSLDYLGKTQRGRTVTTRTNINRDIFQLSFAHEFFDFSEYDCVKCGVLAFFIGAKHDQTNRDISSKGNIVGLTETYKVSMAELGLAWHVCEFLSLDWVLKFSHSEAYDAKLKINFLSSYDNSEITLNRVYENDVELAVSYPLSEHIWLAFMLNYVESKIDKSDKFPLYIKQQQRGTFYQPQREMQAIRFGLQFIANF